jgi:hypothetical protein
MTVILDLRLSQRKVVLDIRHLYVLAFGVVTAYL